MRKIALICAKELRTYFGSLGGYIIVSAFLAVSGVAFFYWVNRYRMSSMRPIFQILTVVLMLTVPAITMRLFAGEFSSGTAELLLVSPVAPFQIVLGKFLFCVVLTLILLLSTFHFPLLLLNYARPDMGEVLSGYIGLALAGAFFCSVGLFASAVTRSSAIAAIIGIAILLGLFLLPGEGEHIDSVVSALSPFEHFSNFARGVFDTADVAYYVLGTSLFLFVTTEVLRLRRRV